MKRCNPRCYANWIYTIRYFPAFVSVLRAVVISIISPHLSLLLSLPLMPPPILTRICILYHPYRQADECCVGLHSQGYPQVYPLRAAGFANQGRNTFYPLNFLKIIFFSLFPSSAFHP